MKLVLLCCLGANALVCAGGEPAAAGRYESLGIPVRKGGLMGCLVGPYGRGGQALYFNFNQLKGRLFLVQVDPDSGQARSEPHG